MNMVPAKKSPYGSHVSMHIQSRNNKAKKIESILSSRVHLADVDLLDLGAGSGILSAYFKSRVRSVTAADREPQSFKAEQIPIYETPGPELPFDDRSFDVVIYNHVIEHVGNRVDQKQSVREIRRVLRPRGVLYLAVPNRWTIIEPHYQLPFLSWLPRQLANAWVRALGRNAWYDCNPFGHRELMEFLTSAEFLVEDVTVQAFYETLKIEKANSRVGRAFGRTPEIVSRVLVPAMPTFVVLAKPHWIPPQ